MEGKINDFNKIFNRWNDVRLHQIRLARNGLFIPGITLEYRRLFELLSREVEELLYHWPLECPEDHLKSLHLANPEKDSEE